MGTTADLSDVLAAISAAPGGPAVAAFLDVDGALVAGTPARLALGRPQGLPARLPVLGTLARREPTDPAAATARLVAGWRGMSEPDVAALGGAMFAGRIADRVYAEGRQLVAAHRRQGHLVVLVSSAPRPLVQPLVEALAADAALCTEPEVVDGRLTGDLAGAVCVGEARAAAVRRLATAAGVDLGCSHAYAGGDDDLPLLSLVGTPRPTNPQRALEAVAEREGWPALRFESRGRPSAEAVARSIATYASMAPSMLGGVAIALLNRDRHQIVQYGVSTWVERMFALSGVTLRVTGEENLWSQRPAVFVYNHRNNFDPYVAIKLVRRDWGSVAKREIAGPLTGVMQWLTPNVAYLDRANHDRAIQSLRPVTELLGRGVSILVAPEGTRSISGQLGPFKKGAFRMAMEAGVPVVPIVIRNADRVAGREASVIRKGTVDVAVLPPVPVADWTAENLDEQVAAVRRLFLETLSAWPEGERAPSVA